MAQAIDVEQLTKSFDVPVREAGLKAALRSLAHRQTTTVTAVDGVSFNLDAGEIVGFLGPNGAGKTTTLKMLSGLLHPSAGRATVLGYTPYDRHRDFLRQITLVMGNRNQLQWDLPALDSFELSRAIYRLGHAEFTQQRDELIELLEIGELVNKPVRNLSLGERMKAELANSLLHRPTMLFLDEPTLGLDVTMQKRIRGFLADYNQRHGATVLLTSHYMADVTALCKRVIVIHHGQVLFDGDLSALSDKFAAYKTLVVTFSQPVDALALAGFGEITESDGSKFAMRIARHDAPRITAQLLADYDVDDLTIEDPAIDDVIEMAFASGRT